MNDLKLLLELGPKTQKFAHYTSKRNNERDSSIETTDRKTVYTLKSSDIKPTSANRFDVETGRITKLTETKMNI